MKLEIKQAAPAFNLADVYGAVINLKALRGSTIYLSFERSAGCPVCNLRTHQLLKQADFFIQHNIKVLMVYESSAEKMHEYLGNEVYPFHFIADPQTKLYNSYGVEISWLKAMKGLLHGLLPKVMQGKRLFKKPMKQDGHLSRIPAEFVIDEDGNIALAHYGRFVGDHLEMGVLKAQLLKNVARVAG
ncbi:MAG: AhpC/TSA family protein [Bacteroidia bacterium]|nr:AhpC/TSA family protein [Bacteroidia bacterium]